MNWKLEYLPEAEKDLKDLNGSQRILVLKAIKKVQQNPLPVAEQGYGKPLGNHSSTNLAGLLKIKLRSAGLRIVYQLMIGTPRNMPSTPAMLPPTVMATMIQRGRRPTDCPRIFGPR